MASTRHAVATFAVLAGLIFFFGLYGQADVWAQNHFYDFESGKWVIVRGERPWLDFLLYDGIKRALIVLYSLMLLALVFGYRHPFVRRHRRELVILVLSGVIVPAVVVGLKNITNVPCPCDWQFYGGTYPPVGVFDSYPEAFEQQHRIRCWPAGHASFGFSLMAFYFVFRGTKERLIALGIALSIAWSMGWYKILKGDHFLSHTIIAMAMGWLLILLIVMSVDRVGRRRAESVDIQ